MLDFDIDIDFDIGIVVDSGILICLAEMHVVVPFRPAVEGEGCWNINYGNQLE